MSPSPNSPCHNREYTVFLRPHKGGMMLHTMYYAEEVREVESFGRFPMWRLKTLKSRLRTNSLKRWRGSGSRRNIATPFKRI